MRSDVSDVSGDDTRVTGIEAKYRPPQGWHVRESSSPGSEERLHDRVSGDVARWKEVTQFVMPHNVFTEVETPVSSRRV